MANIIQVNMLEQALEDLRAYALYVNRIRAIPLVNDGLKSIHRRILWAVYHYSKATNRYVKSSAVVGDTMKYMHPHGDSSIYGAMKPLTNWFEINLPLLDGDQGNWGDMQGADAAAPRYTETKMTQLAQELVIGELGLTDNAVDWNKTYDDRSFEPASLPVKLPLLLINGSFGVGYGLKVEIPTHNINEVIDATINLIKNPDAPVVLIPDQCTKCEIIESNFKAISNKGHGTFKVRGIVEVSEYKKNPALIIRSVPDLVFYDNIETSIHNMIEKKQLPQIVDILDQTSEEELHVTIVLKQGSDPEYVKDILYKNTLLQKTVNVNFEVLDGYNPVRMSYKSYLQSFIEYRKMTKFRVYCDVLQTAQTRKHEIETYIKVLESGEIDNIINMIKSSDINENDLIEYLITKLSITDLQAKFIIQSRLKNLSIGYLSKYKSEYEQLVKNINCYLNIITNDSAIEQEIIQELEEIKAKYGKPRLSKVIGLDEVNNIPKGTFKIIITENNFIKKVGAESSLGSFKNDTPKFVITGENKENILLFDEQGKVFKLPIHKIPVSQSNSNGIDIRMLQSKLTSNICMAMYEPKILELSKSLNKYFMTILTKSGYIKKLDLEDFLSVPPSGIIFMKLNEEDIIQDVTIILEGLDVIVYSKNKALRMNMSEVPHQKRNSKGMRAITEDLVDGLAIVKPNATDVVVVTENGKINRFSIVALPNLGRNKAGSRVIKLAKGDSIKFMACVQDTDVLKVKTQLEVVEFLISNLDVGSSMSTGKKMISVKGNSILACAVL